jgi:plasmid stability protein
MATLRLDKFPDSLYRKLKLQAKRHHRSVEKEVLQLLSKVLEGQGVYSIMELEGLGKEIWEQVETAEYIAQERESWEHRSLDSPGTKLP